MTISQEKTSEEQRESSTLEKRCLDCGASGVGAYCQVCGQPHDTQVLPIGQLVKEAVADLLSADGRTAKTLKILFRYPGRLTLDYLAGRRTRFLPPLRLYLVASLTYFLVVALTGSFRFLLLGTTVRIGDVVSSGPLADLLVHMPKLMLILVIPLFALMLRAFYVKRRGLATEYAVFALHYWAFAFLVFPLDSLAQYPGWAFGHASNVQRIATLGISLALYVYVLVYLTLALRRVFGGSLPGALARSVGLWGVVTGLEFMLIELVSPGT